MEKGSYTKRRVNFDDYAASFFTPHIFPGYEATRFGCGASALSILTGVSPDIVSAKNGGPDYSDEFILRFLRQKGFSTLALTWCNVSTGPTRIGREHVILLSQLFTKNEGTWGVIFNGYYFHNFDIYAVEHLSFVNKPILSAYLVSSASWGSPGRLKSGQHGSMAKRKLKPLDHLRIGRSTIYSGHKIIPPGAQV